MIFYLFPADMNMYPARNYRKWILTYSDWTFDPESL